jgi:hypothetical protein
MEAAVIALQPNGEWRVESYRLDSIEACPATMPPSDTVLQRVKGPAIGLIATAILNWVAIPAIVMAMVFVGAGPNSLIGDGLVVVPIAAFVLCTVMLVGALKMKRLENPTWAVAASMLAMFISPGNIIGLPLGIWAMVVLGRPEVRAAFRNKRQPQEPTPRDTLLGRLGLGLFIGGLLGTIAIMAMSPRQEMALIFGAVALVLALVFGAMGWRERLGRLAVFCTLAALVGLPASFFSAFWTEQACSIVTLLPRAKEQERAMIERQEAARARAARASAPVIERVRVSVDKAAIEGCGSKDSWLVIKVGKDFLRCGVVNDSHFTATIERAWWSGGFHCVVKDSRGKTLFAGWDNKVGLMTKQRGQLVFREGTPSPEADGSYVIGEFRPDNGTPLPITVRLETPSLLQGTDMMQEVVKDVQPDGTIRFKTVITQHNTTGEPLTALRFYNSDFIRVDKLTDPQGRTIAFSLTRTGQMTLRYDAPLAEPVKPGAEFSYVMEGTETGLVKRLPQPGEFEYTMRHWPGNMRTRRIERHLLPTGARLLSKTPAELTERTRDGRVELFIDRIIPSGDSLEIRYTFRLPTKP